VGLAGLVQSGGLGSFSKHYGTAAGSLLQAEVVTADGAIRIANACTNPDLFWALKRGGGGSFGVVSKLTLRLHELPEFFSPLNFTVKAASDYAYQRLIPPVREPLPRTFVQWVSGHEPSAAKAHQASARRPFTIAELKSLLEIATPE
jgi:FAD/FMN-containing dehydrogenase